MDGDSSLEGDPSETGWKGGFLVVTYKLQGEPPFFFFNTWSVVTEVLY